MAETDPAVLIRNREGPPRPSSTYFRSVEFSSDGATLRGRLYLPERLPAPVVVMAHGFSATIPMAMDRYAEVFRERGLAVFAYDHPGHGTSDGEPRGEINYWVQARGYIEAIGAAAALPEIDKTRIAVWSDSLSAQVALGVAALEHGWPASSARCRLLVRDRVGRPDGSRLDAIRPYFVGGEFRRPSDTLTSMPVVSPDQAATGPPSSR